MPRIRMLDPQDPLPEGGRYAVVLQRFDADDPAAVVVELLLSRAGHGVEARLLTTDAGTTPDFRTALRQARTVAAQEGIDLIYAVDRTAGPLAREVRARHGDHSFPGEALDDFDWEEGEAGPDLRDR